jgi:hypothetical protein
VVPAALARAEALDGYYVLETTRTTAEADASALLAEWKGQWQVEHRHRDDKGPLRIRPLFVTSNRRIVGLLLILGITLMVFSLLERAARWPPGREAPACWRGMWRRARPATTCSRRWGRSRWSGCTSPGAGTAPCRR